MPGIKHIPFQAAVAFDQLLNALTGGWADETLSARCWRLRDKSRGWRWACLAVDAVFFWQAGHCRQSYESERKRTHLPPGMRG